MIRIALIVSSLVVAPLTALAGEELTAREIMERVDARPDGEFVTQDMEMTLIDKRGGKRVRKLRSWGRDVGEDEQSILFFLSPADVEDTGFLTYDYDDPEKPTTTSGSTCPR